VIRPWELPVETLMAGAPLTLPLVALTGLPLRELPAVIGRLQERLSDAPREQAGLIWTSIDWLLGARLRPEVVAGLLAGVEEIMRESSTYQQVLAEGRAEGRTEGRAEGERRALLRVGERRLGPASPRVQAEVAALADLDRIERLTDRLFDVTSWDELLATP
jgi:predicted transposase YdaD